jgi:hypothetical protein
MLIGCEKAANPLIEMIYDTLYPPQCIKHCLLMSSIIQCFAEWSIVMALP